MVALEAPQDKHGQEHRTGTSRAEQTTEAMAELGAQEAMADGLRGPSATASISTTGRQAAEMASAATKQGAACPRQVSMDKT